MLLFYIKYINPFTIFVVKITLEVKYLFEFKNKFNYILSKKILIFNKFLFKYFNCWRRI